jgi:hypothetical protein
MPQIAKRLDLIPQNIPTPVLRGIEVGTLFYFHKYLGDTAQEQAVVGGLIFMGYEFLILSMDERPRPTMYPSAKNKN